MKIIKTRQRKVATTGSKKDSKLRGLNKYMMQLEKENEEFRKVLGLATLQFPAHAGFETSIAGRARNVLDKFPICNHLINWSK